MVPGTKYLVVEGDITLFTTGRKRAERFKLTSFEITTEVRHGKFNPAENLEPHPIECGFSSLYSRVYAPTSQSTADLFPAVSPIPHPGHPQVTTSDHETYMGLGHQRQDGFPETFIMSYPHCHPEKGCSSDDPTSLSVRVKACLIDTHPGAPPRTVEHILVAHYDGWPRFGPNNCATNSMYDLHFSGLEASLSALSAN